MYFPPVGPDGSTGGNPNLFGVYELLLITVNIADKNGRLHDNMRWPKRLVAAGNHCLRCRHRLATLTLLFHWRGHCYTV